MSIFLFSLVFTRAICGKMLEIRKWYFPLNCGIYIFPPSHWHYTCPTVQCIHVNLHHQGQERQEHVALKSKTLSNIALFPYLSNKSKFEGLVGQTEPTKIVIFNILGHALCQQFRRLLSVQFTFLYEMLFQKPWRAEQIFITVSTQKMQLHPKRKQIDCLAKVRVLQY